MPSSSRALPLVHIIDTDIYTFLSCNKTVLPTTGSTSFAWALHVAADSLNKLQARVHVWIVLLGDERHCQGPLRRKHCKTALTLCNDKVELGKVVGIGGFHPVPAGILAVRSPPITGNHYDGRASLVIAAAKLQQLNPAVSNKFLS